MPPVPPTPSSLACLQPHDPFPCDKQAAPSPTLSPTHPVPHRLLTLGSGLLTAFSLSLSLSLSHTHTHSLPPSAGRGRGTMAGKGEEGSGRGSARTRPQGVGR